MRAFLVGTLAAFAAVPSVAEAGEAVCSIRVHDAPPEVRDALVGWASGEKICHALEVRITPTGEGYSLWARADDGRTFTRWVADAKTAAVLVVSWAGDDTLPAADPPSRSRSIPTTHVHESAQPASPRSSNHSVALDAPPRIERSGGDAERSVTRGRTKQIVVAAVANPGAGEDVYARTGLRASIDLTTHEAWRVGIAGMLSDERVNIYDDRAGERIAHAYEPRASAIAYIARSVARERLRLGLGAGFAYMQLSDVIISPGVGTVMLERVGIFAPAIELSALGSIPITKRWAITGGVVITATGPSATNGLLTNEDYSFASDHDGGTQIVGVLGVVRWR
ncbi:MAG: hypothetical protein ACKV2T_28845 [Kofleriaceae bacterium]